MEPTTLEMLATLEAKSGPAISRETYSFDDKAGRKLALRFDLTVGMTRYVASRRDLKMPVKLAALAGVWRYDEPQAGRYRYFHQWDIEIYGPFSRESDAEVIAFVSSFFEKLGLEVEIHINDRKLIEEYMRSTLGVKSDSDVMEMFRAIDKVPKKGPDNVLAEYKDRIDPAKLSSLLSISTMKGDADSVASSSPELAALTAWSSVVALMNSLTARGIKNAILDLGVVRGLDYYSGPVFEVFDKAGGAALVGGGRYDNMVDVFGRKDIGATGAAGGIERILSVLAARGLLKPAGTGVDAYVAYTSEDSATDAVKVASLLRKEGISAEYDLSGRSLKRQLEDAFARDARFAIIVSPENFSKGLVSVRVMKDGREAEYPVKELPRIVRTSSKA